MKSILPVALLLFAAFVSSCNKCYECKTTSDTQTYCKETAAYDVLKAGGSLTDSNGQQFSCKLK